MERSCSFPRPSRLERAFDCASCKMFSLRCQNMHQSNQRSLESIRCMQALHYQCGWGYLGVHSRHFPKIYKSIAVLGGFLMSWRLCHDGDKPQSQQDLSAGGTKLPKPVRFESKQTTFVAPSLREGHIVHFFLFQNMM